VAGGEGVGVIAAEAVMGGVGHITEVCDGDSSLAGLAEAVARLEEKRVDLWLS
jgi:hypothetical protein